MYIYGIICPIAIFAYLCLVMGPRYNNTSVRLNTPGAQS